MKRLAAMEEGRDRPSESYPKHLGFIQIPAAMEEGEIDPRRRLSRPGTPRKTCRNGGGPRSTLGVVLWKEPKWHCRRRNGGGPRSTLGGGDVRLREGRRPAAMEEGEIDPRSLPTHDYSVQSAIAAMEEGEIDPRRSGSTSVKSPARSPQWRRAEIDPRRARVLFRC